MYIIRYDPVRCIFRLKLSGFWTMATVIKFGADLLLRSTAVRVRGKRYAILSDASDFPVQSAHVSEYFERIMRRGIEMEVGPCAIIVASQLNKVQAERVFDKELVRVFMEPNTAEAWLQEVWR